jgi:preprotein translocase subunit SecA
MLGKFIQKLFGSQAERTFKKTQPQIEEINQIFAGLAQLSDGQLQAKTAEFKDIIRQKVGGRYDEVEKLSDELRQDLQASEREKLNDRYDALDQEVRRLEGEALDEIMPQAYALVKEACRRLMGRTWDRAGEAVEWDMVPFDVQLYGAIVLHQGKIAEMATGEGKTLVGTMPLYLNALTGRGTHLITHNNHLAKRDAQWVGPVFNFLGLSVSVVQDARQTGGADAYILPVPEGVPAEFNWVEGAHKDAYLADITYATKDQVGFDYLWDNMCTRREDLMQREFNFAIVDEADSNLIDDARTPLIVSGPVPDSTNRYNELKPLVEKLLRAQASEVNRLIAAVEKMRKEGGDEYEIGTDLLKATRGAPRNRRLQKILQEEGIKRLIGRVEADYMRDKRLQDIDEALYFAVDEKNHTIDLTEQGRDLLSPDEQALFILPDISQIVGDIRKEADLDADQKREKEEDAYRDHSSRSEAVHNINQLMKAYTLFEKDVQYIIDDNRKVVIIDESTGRPQPGRRFSDGLHQALEAKEGVKVEQETQTVARITLQNLFRMYRKLAGMTGTAETEAHELWEIYKLDVEVLPTNRPIRRVDHEDQIFRTKREKLNAIIDEIARLNEKQIPVLVGTISVEDSELLARMMTRRGIKHQLLNARYHEQESQIVSQAGQPGAVTIATNMAGRGTDIKLADSVVRIERRKLDDDTFTLQSRLGGGSLRDELSEKPSGLQVIGTERHESRRIDRQLRGRAGRQGDPGSSRFFLSLEDNLMRLFGSERIASVMDKLGAEEGEVIEHSLVTRSIERAQKKVEARNFEMRKHLLEYDDVLNQQREVIYSRRRDVLERESVRDQVLELAANVVDGLLATHVPVGLPPSEWAWDDLQEVFLGTFFTAFPIEDSERGNCDPEDLRTRLVEAVHQTHHLRAEAVGEETFRRVEQAIVLHTVDTCWQEHLYEMDALQEGIGFVGVGGKNPLIEYKRSSFDMFEQLIARIDQDTVKELFGFRLVAQAPPVAESPRRVSGRMRQVHSESTNLGFGGKADAGAESPPQPAAPVVPGRPPRSPQNLSTSGGGQEAEAQRVPAKAAPKVGRNDPCPCGSGKKYKRCHGRES